MRVYYTGRHVRFRHVTDTLRLYFKLYNNIPKQYSLPGAFTFLGVQSLHFSSALTVNLQVTFGNLVYYESLYFSGCPEPSQF